MSATDGDRNVTVAPLGRTSFLTWNEFHEYLTEYQERTFQIYAVRTTTPVSARNKRITEKYSRRGESVPLGELLPKEMVAYSKIVVCTRHGRPRPRSTGLRTSRPSRAINCPAQITLVLKKDQRNDKWFVHVSSHTARHNHQLSDVQYRRHPLIRKISDPTVLQTMHTLQKAEVAPAKILEYVREHTDKDLGLKDVHNMLASFRRSPPATDAAPPALDVAAPFTIRSTVRRPPIAPPEPPQHFTVRDSLRPALLPDAPSREAPTQYAKFLATFNVCKELAEVAAEMDTDRFERCYAELRTFLRIAESGRVPVVTIHEDVGSHNNVLSYISNTTMPQEQQAFQLSSATGPSVHSEASTTAIEQRSLQTPSSVLD